MKRIEVNTQTGASAEIDLTPEEEAEASARTAAEASDPQRLKRAAIKQLAIAANADALMAQLANATLADIWQHVNDTFPALTVAQRKTIAIALAGAAMIFRERG